MLRAGLSGVSMGPPGMGLGYLGVESVDTSVLGYPRWHRAAAPGRQQWPICPIALYPPLHE